MTCPRCNGIGSSVAAGQTFTCSRCCGSGGSPPNFYAGIGSRETPEPVLLEMQTIAMQLALRGFALRSGCAIGADSAFEKGCKVVGGKKVLRTLTQWQPALDHAQQFHPAWEKCSETARGLHARNSLIMLGDDLDLPVSFVVCWTQGGGAVGGTGQALRIAEYHAIPVFNLAVTPVAALWEWLSSCNP